MKRIEPCSAGFPACGFTELSSSVFPHCTSDWGLESPQNPQTGISALRRWAVGAAPFPVFRSLAQMRIHGIHRRVGATAMRVLMITNQMVERLSLPKLSAGSLQKFVRFARRIAFPALKNL